MQFSNQRTVQTNIRGQVHVYGQVCQDGLSAIEDVFKGQHELKLSAQSAHWKHTL